MTADKIARRILSRARRMSYAYACGPFRTADDGSMVKIGVDGYEYRASVRRIDDSYERPFGFDHITEDRRHSDQFRLALAFAKAVADLSDADMPEDDVDVWHKAGTAGFVAVDADGARHLVEVSEFTFEMQMAEAKAANA